MAETVIISSDSEPDAPPKKLLPKRRRLLTSTAIPVYSTQVEKGLKILDDPVKLSNYIKERCKNLAFSSEDEDEEKPIPLKQLKSRPRFQFSKLNLNHYFVCSPFGRCQDLSCSPSPPPLQKKGHVKAQ